MNIVMKTALVAAAALGMTSVAQAQDFTGPRAEVRVGFDSLDLNVQKGVNVDGATYGVAVGYDVALAPRVIVGMDAAIDGSSADDTLAGALKVEARRDIEIGARIGYVLTPSVMVYGRGAYSNARVGIDLGNRDLGSQINEGWRVGGGAEFALSRNLYAKGEYRYTNYNQNIERHQGLVGLGVRF
jgi:outer membrane immunogenic protein